MLLGIGSWMLDALEDLLGSSVQYLSPEPRTTLCESGDEQARQGSQSIS